MARRENAKTLNHEEFKEALFQWAIRHDPGENYIDDDEGILAAIEKYQESLPVVSITIQIPGGDLGKLARSVDDLDVSELARRNIRKACGMPDDGSTIIED